MSGGAVGVFHRSYHNARHQRGAPRAERRRQRFFAFVVVDLSGWVTFDNVTLARVTSAPDAAGGCVDNGAAWTCNHVGANFFNVLREQYGVPSPRLSFPISSTAPNDAITSCRLNTSNPSAWRVLWSVALRQHTGCAVRMEESVNEDGGGVDADLVAGLGWDAAAAAGGGFASADVRGCRVTRASTSPSRGSCDLWTAGGHGAASRGAISGSTETSGEARNLFSTLSRGSNASSAG